MSGAHSLAMTLLWDDAAWRGLQDDGAAPGDDYRYIAVDDAVHGVRVAPAAICAHCGSVAVFPMRWRAAVCCLACHYAAHREDDDRAARPDTALFRSLAPRAVRCSHCGHATTGAGILVHLRACWQRYLALLH